MSRFSPENVMPADEGVQVKAVVKWFNASKGFGFVAPDNGMPDAFLHISVINRAGHNSLLDGTEMVCFVAQGPKGPQVTRIVEITGVAASAEGNSSGQRHPFQRPYDGGGSFPKQRDNFEPFHRSAPTGPEIEAQGTVKWFKPDKGFGFVAPDGSDKDVFVHKSVLRRCGMVNLEPGQRVHMRIQEADKGREATWITLL